MPYTAHLTSKPGQGVALVELYDAEQAGATARLVNVFARAQVETGAGILIAGFVIAGAQPTRVLIRAIGPSLSQFGVSAPLADPQLDVAPLGGGPAIASNDDWGGEASLAAAFSSVKAFDLPGSSSDAASIVTLPAGAYTAQVRGANGSTGVALVEVYELPP